MTTKPNFNHCFEPVAHEPHFWTGGHCSGQGINPDGYVKPLDPATSKEQNADSEKSDTQELLDGRRETYGDVVWNAERVAKMWESDSEIILILSGLSLSVRKLALQLSPPASFTS